MELLWRLTAVHRDRLIFIAAAGFVMVVLLQCLCISYGYGPLFLSARHQIPILAPPPIDILFDIAILLDIAPFLLRR